jgi:ABC-type antimicrobial peptide transport system permease subunit
MPGGRGRQDTRVARLSPPQSLPQPRSPGANQSETERTDEEMFYLRYLAAELRRRKGRTVLTALGLGIGVGLVVTVTALSDGLDDAQAEVLEPLTGVGTDMSVGRPVTVEEPEEGGEPEFGIGPGAGLSAKEQRQLERENGAARVGLAEGEPGERFHNQSFVTQELSFPERQTTEIAAIDGVEGVAGALTLNSMEVSGRVPEEAGTGGPVIETAPPSGGGGPENISINQSTVSGIDASEPELGLITPGQISDGRYLRASDERKALVSVTHAEEEGIAVGDEIKVGGKNFDVVGIADLPLGGESSDVYLPLEQLQNLSDREGRINVLRVRAESSDHVATVASEIEASFNGSEVTTAEDLAERVSGSLVDAQNLSDKLGIALAVVALGAAFLIASLLTLSSVNKRTRELGTLKALGWRQRLVIRQVTGESVVQGLLGGLAGAVIGIGGAALIGALGISLDASVAAEQTGFGAPGSGPFGQGAVETGSSTVALDAPVDLGLLLLAIGLAVVGGVIAGAVGGGRAARLRPAEALRSVE